MELGITVQDKITGFKGIVTGYVKYITGCNQALVSPQVDATGALKESHWFDEQRLVIDDKLKPITLDNGKTPGCDKPAPKR